MMKKISIFFLALILIFSMAGCGAESDPQTSEPADHVESETDTEPADITGADETELTYDADTEVVTNDKEPAGEAGAFDLEQNFLLMQTLFNDETISSIAEAHGKTSAQVILRWHLQAGNIAIPGSSNEAHIQENFEIFDFELSEEEMQRMTDIDKDQRFAGY